jgi:hypothetical protein
VPVMLNRILSLSSLVATAAAAQASSIFDNTAASTSTTFRSGANTPALHITNTNATSVTLSYVAFLGHVPVAQNLKFFLANNTGTILNSVAGAYSATGVNSLVGHSVNWTLAPGQTYYIGAQFDGSQMEFGYGFSFPTQNGLKSGNNGNFAGYANPGFYGDGGADMSWQLQAVPEPGTMAALAFAGAGLIRRRRKSA